MWLLGLSQACKAIVKSSKGNRKGLTKCGVRRYLGSYGSAGESGALGWVSCLVH